jgi:hypothetical protein
MRPCDSESAMSAVPPDLNHRLSAHLKNLWKAITMMNDPIVAEVRKVREQHANKFNFDLNAIFRDLKQKEQASGRQYVSYPPRPSRLIASTHAEQS